MVKVAYYSSFNQTIMQLWSYHAYSTLQLQPNSGKSTKHVMHTMSMLCRGKEAAIFTELG